MPHTTNDSVRSRFIGGVYAEAGSARYGSRARRGVPLEVVGTCSCTERMFLLAFRGARRAPLAAGRYFA